MVNGERQTASGVVKTSAGVAQTVDGAVMYESFESGDLDNYDDPSGLSTTTEVAQDGIYSLVGDGSMFRSDDKPGPSRGSSFRVYFQAESSFNSEARLYYAANSDHDTYYRIRIDQNGSVFSTHISPSGNDRILDLDYERSGAAGEWRYMDVDFGETSFNDISVTVYKENGDVAADGTVTEDRLDSGTFGFAPEINSGENMYMDAFQEIEQ